MNKNGLSGVGIMILMAGLLMIFAEQVISAIGTMGLGIALVILSVVGIGSMVFAIK